MFELAKSARQQREFKLLWEDICHKSGWANDPYAENGDRYNLLLPKNSFLKRKKVIGTIEFIPYLQTNQYSAAEERFKFSELPEIKSHMDRVWEIDKLCLHARYQRRGYFRSFSHIFFDHINKYSPKYYLGLIEKKFYRMLRFTFGSNVKQKGKALTGPNTALIPAVIDIECIQRDEKAIRSFMNLDKKTTFTKKAIFCK